MIEHIEPKAMADSVAVYCAHDKIMDIDELVGNPRNPNKHPKEQISALAKIIKRQGAASDCGFKPLRVYRKRTRTLACSKGTRCVSCASGFSGL